MRLEKQQRKPEWLRKKISFSAQKDMDQLLNANGIHTICQEAKCPNISECFAAKTATFLMLGGICTRRCTYCTVTTGTPDSVNKEEIDQVTDAVKQLGLKFVVITSPARDDLKDGGADQFVRVMVEIRRQCPDTRVEILVPDFKGSIPALDRVCAGLPDMFNHNVETVPRLYPSVRPRAGFQRSLEVLSFAAARGLLVKSGFG